MADDFLNSMAIDEHGRTPADPLIDETMGYGLFLTETLWITLDPYQCFK